MSSFLSAAFIREALDVSISFDFNANKIVMDTRLLKAGDMFVALTGGINDGHNFVKDAIQKGAVACLVSEEFASKVQDKSKLVIVKDTKEALTKIAHKIRSKTNAKIIGITGSVGKTTTKECFKTVFSALSKTYGNLGNLNNDLGVPLSFAELQQEDEVAIFEMGMNHKGEISHLTAIVKPNIAVITTIEPVHLEYFDSVTGIADAKAEIFEGLAPNGSAILNHDNAYFEHLASKASGYGVKNIYSFGEHKDASSRMLSFTPGENEAVIEANILGETIKYKISSIAKTVALATLSTLLAVKILGMDLKKASKALEQFGSLKGRGKFFNLLVAGKHLTIIDDSYNAGPSSVTAALKVLSSYKGNSRKIAILAEMYELGSDSQKMHAGLADVITSLGNIDGVITVGPLMTNLYEKLPQNLKMMHFENVAALKEYGFGYMKEDDLILLKGSKGTRLYTYADDLITYEIKEKSGVVDAI